MGKESSSSRGKEAAEVKGSLKWGNLDKNGQGGNFYRMEKLPQQNVWVPLLVNKTQKILLPGQDFE